MVSQTRVDSARSWAIAVACGWINAFTTCVVKSSGIIYVGTVRAFDVDRQLAAWPVTMSLVFYCICGLLAGILSRYITIWKITMTGCVLGGIAVSTCFYAEDIVFLIAVLGAVHGSSIGLATLQPVVINQHFKRYRAAASGINGAGYTIGGLVFPVLIQALYDQYGFRGTFLILGAIMLNSAAGAFLHRDVPHTADLEDLESTYDPVRESSVDERMKMVDDRGVLGFDTPHAPRRSSENVPRVDAESNLGEDNCQLKCTTAIQNVCKNGVDTNMQGKEMMNRTLKDSRKKPLVFSDEHLDAFLEQQQNGDYKVMSFGAPTKPDNLLSFLSHWKFYLIAISFALTMNSMTVYLTVIVDFAADRGVTRWKAVSLITSYNVSDLAARLGSGWITDRGILSRGTMMGSHVLLGGVVQYLIPLCNDYAYQMVMSVAFGWCIGCVFILVTVLFVELVGVEKLGVCYGVATVMTGLVSFGRPPLIGHYRDHLGDYEGLFNLSGGLSVGLAMIWLCLSAWEIYKLKCSKNG